MMPVWRKPGQVVTHRTNTVIEIKMLLYKKHRE